jgi:hypothetical protein
MEVISWTNRVKMGAVLHNTYSPGWKEHAATCNGKLEANGIGHVLSRDCLLKRVIERNI